MNPKDIIISSIVAAGENSAIGLKNGLPWRLPNDLKFYKYTTWGLPVIMGRNSFESMDKKCLPGRYNIILTSQKDLKAADNAELWTASTPEEALELARATDCKEIFITGGAKVYAAFMDRTDRIFLTRVHASPEADTFFPEPDWKEWTLKRSRRFEADDRHAFAYTFETWERR
jgi:dihydrofolate reductase